MKSIKIILMGIMFVLISLFLLGICILNRDSGGLYPELLSLICLALGIILFAIGIVKKTDG